MREKKLGADCVELEEGSVHLQCVELVEVEALEEQAEQGLAAGESAGESAEEPLAEVRPVEEPAGAPQAYLFVTRAPAGRLAVLAPGKDSMVPAGAKHSAEEPPEEPLGKSAGELTAETTVALTEKRVVVTVAELVALEPQVVPAVSKDLMT